MIRDWQGGVLDLVADEGMSQRSKARFLALGVNGVGVALMIVVFAHTGGLVGAEVGVAGGTAVLAQRVLEAVFGDQAVRRLAETAKEDLDSRVQALLSSELLRYHAVLDGLGLDAEHGDRLRAAVRAVERGRRRRAGLDPGRSETGLGAPRTSRWRSRRRAFEQVPLDVRPRPRRHRRRRDRRAGQPTVPPTADAVRATPRNCADGPRMSRLQSRTDPGGRAVRGARGGGRAVCGRVDEDAVAGPRRGWSHQADRRLAFSGGATVVALAGATGSGKSSLFNALSGTESGRGRRPTSDHLACAWP